MKKIIFLFLLFICCVITSCNKWELSDEEVLYGTVKCIEKNYKPSYSTIVPVMVNKTVICTTQYHPAQYNVLVDYMFENLSFQKDINDKELYSKLDVGKAYDCKIIKYTYFCEKKVRYKTDYKNLEILF